MGEKLLSGHTGELNKMQFRADEELASRPGERFGFEGAQRGELPRPECRRRLFQVVHQKAKMVEADTHVSGELGIRRKRHHELKIEPLRELKERHANPLTSYLDRVSMARETQGPRVRSDAVLNTANGTPEVMRSSRK